MVLRPLKAAMRAAIAAPGVRHGLRWFINEPHVPASLRDSAHRILAKRARFRPDRTFSFTTREGTSLRFLHRGTANYLYWQRDYEPETTSLFMMLARRSQVIFDVGAADGIYAVLAAATNPDARVFAFEPGSRAAATCARNVELNRPVTDRVEVIRKALGSVDAPATLYVAGEFGGTSSLNPRFRRDRAEETIEVGRGDAFVTERDIRKVDLLKLDTESTEPDVLRGFQSTLTRDRPDIVCEVLADRTEQELENELRPHGYGFFAVRRDGLVARQQITADRSYREPNYLFTVRTPADLRALGVPVASEA